MKAGIGSHHAQTRRVFIVGCATLPLADCASMAPKTTPLKFLVQADKSINPDEQGNPYPIVLRIYELKQDTQFNQMSYFDLADSDTNKLGADLVAKREIELKPGDTQKFERDTPVETRYIGVIAGFRNIQNAQWRAVGEIKPERGNQIVIQVTAYAVSLKAVADKTLGLF
ncbi:MAG: type VI secretion system lipoprotein TssJ [Methylovirgula sp.]